MNLFGCMHLWFGRNRSFHRAVQSSSSLLKTSAVNNIIAKNEYKKSVHDLAEQVLRGVNELNKGRE